MNYETVPRDLKGLACVATISCIFKLIQNERIKLTRFLSFREFDI